MTAPRTMLGIDVGGTKIAAGLVEFPSGRIISERRIPTRPERPPKVVLADLASLAQEIAAEIPPNAATISGIGLGICELVDPDGRIFSSNCLNWRSEEIRALLDRIAPLTIEADVRAGALAEALFGAGQNHRTFVYVSVGTGISSCLVIEGRPHTGATGAAGTMASSSLAITCERCGETNKRTLEQIATGPALVEAYNLRGALKKQSGKEVIKAAETGDAEAERIVISAGECLGSYIAHLINILDPEAIVIGGGLGTSEGLYAEAVMKSVRRHTWSPTQLELPVRKASAGVSAGLIGAAAAAWKKRFV